MDFESRDLPWLDRPFRQIDEYVDTLGPEAGDKAELRYRLLNWSHFGYAIIPRAIEPELIDALMADLDELIENHERFHVMVESHIHEHTPIKEIDIGMLRDFRDGRSDLAMRIQDFIHNSIAAKKISLHPNITGFLEHVFRDRVVAFQSLNFTRGSEQHIHQDYAFVPSNPRARLAASWVALEDVHEDAGPLVYIPGSHLIRKFDWGEGLYKLPDTSRDTEEFQEHILRESRRAGLPKLTFCPRKGDAFIWHGALAHGGAEVKDPQTTRRSYVTHYGVAETHREHVQAQGRAAQLVEYPGGFALRHPTYPDEDDAFTRGA
jgi:phytanoyl-CoA hydroxylase